MLTTAQSFISSPVPPTRRFVARYGATIVSGGIASIPTALFLYQGQLGLTPQEVWFVSAILSHKWNADLPHPSLKKLAERSGISEQQLHAYKGQLVKKGYLSIVSRYNNQGGQAPNAYDFGTLFERLEVFLVRDNHDDERGRESTNYDSEDRGLNPSLVGGLNPSLDKEETEQEEIKLSNIRKEKTDKKFLEEVYQQTTLVREEDTAYISEKPKPCANYITPFQTSSSSFTSLGDTIAPRKHRLVGRGSLERDAILSPIQQFAQEFGDKASLKSSTSRAYNLYRRSGLNQKAFMNCLWEARAITREPGRQVSSKMGYFFSVLAERAGVV